MYEMEFFFGKSRVDDPFRDLMSGRIEGLSCNVIVELLAS